MVSTRTGSGLSWYKLYYVLLTDCTTEHRHGNYPNINGTPWLVCYLREAERKEAHYMYLLCIVLCIVLLYYVLYYVYIVVPGVLVGW